MTCECASTFMTGRLGGHGQGCCAAWVACDDICVHFLQQDASPRNPGPGSQCIRFKGGCMESSRRPDCDLCQREP